jgi:hypothetical protein
MEKCQLANMRGYTSPFVDLSQDGSDRDIHGRRVSISTHSPRFTRREVRSAYMKRRIRVLFNEDLEDEKKAIKAKEDAICAKEQDIQDREDERKLAMKCSTKSEGKVFIKTTRSHYEKGFIAEMIADPSSYARETMTPEEQVKAEPSFIGDAFYYNLAKPAVSISFPAYETRTNI